MKYDWSRLDAGWRFEPRSASVRADALVHTSDRGSDRHFAIEELERGDDPAGLHTSYWRMGRMFAKDQLAKCRIDNTPLFEAMDKMAAEIPAEEWKKVPQYPDGLRCKSCGADRPHECPGPGGWVIPRHDPTLFVQEPSQPCPECGQHGLHVCESPTPSQPWRRGPLAAWTLINISCHDGRLTVVMKRGRGELVMDTGPDDETLWERLGAKVVEVDKAKAEAKEKSDG